MLSHFVRLLIRVCAVVLPLMALHRFFLAEEPGYDPPERIGYRASSLKVNQESLYSAEWKAKLVALEVAEAHEEVTSLEAELAVARANAALQATQ